MLDDKKYDDLNDFVNTSQNRFIIKDYNNIYLSSRPMNQTKYWVLLTSLVTIFSVLLTPLGTTLRSNWDQIHPKFSLIRYHDHEYWSTGSPTEMKEIDNIFKDWM